MYSTIGQGTVFLESAVVYRGTTKAYRLPLTCYRLFASLRLRGKVIQEFSGHIVC